jgi:hypothetical protein
MTLLLNLPQFPTILKNPILIGFSVQHYDIATSYGSKAYVINY